MTDQRPPIVRDSYLLPVPHSSLPCLVDTLKMSSNSQVWPFYSILITGCPIFQPGGQLPHSLRKHLVGVSSHSVPGASKVSIDPTGTSLENEMNQLPFCLTPGKYLQELKASGLPPFCTKPGTFQLGIGDARSGWTTSSLGMS